MLQLLCHLWGDFILQNHWMATNKTNRGIKGEVACHIHCMLYVLPFSIFLHPSDWAIVVIYVTHYLIDRYRLAKYVQMIRNWHFEGNGTPAPDWLSVWLMFITDNIFHITINYLALKYL